MALLPNQSDVLSQSGLIGWEDALTYSPSDRVTTSSSGGGSVGFGFYGAGVSAGATAGDTAKLAGLYATRIDSLPAFSTTIVFHTSPTPYTDDVELGFCGNDVNQRGAYLDLASGEYHAGSTTAAATLPSSNRAQILHIEVDTVAGTATFTQTGLVNETVEINDYDDGDDGICVANSNGGGETTYIYYARQQYGGDVL